MLVSRHWQSSAADPELSSVRRVTDRRYPPELARRTRLIKMHQSSLRTPLDRAKLKRDAIEGELRKCPDFQLYLLTSSPKARVRMEQILLQLPNFRLWHVLTHSIGRAELRLERSSVAELARGSGRIGAPEMV